MKIHNIAILSVIALLLIIAPAQAARRNQVDYSIADGTLFENTEGFVTLDDVLRLEITGIDLEQFERIILDVQIDDVKLSEFSFSTDKCEKKRRTQKCDVKIGDIYTNFLENRGETTLVNPMGDWNIGVYAENDRTEREKIGEVEELNLVDIPTQLNLAKDWYKGRTWGLIIAVAGLLIALLPYSIWNRLIGGIISISGVIFALWPFIF